MLISWWNLRQAHHLCAVACYGARFIGRENRNTKSRVTRAKWWVALIEPQMMKRASGMSKECGVHDQDDQIRVRLKLQTLNEWIV
jgi:hypothetical protein